MVQRNPSSLEMYEDFILKEVTLINYQDEEIDVQHLRIRIDIYEDMFHNCCSGMISISDALDLPHLFPFVGAERIRITFSKPLPVRRETDSDESIEFSKTFRIYNVSDRQVTRNNHQVYTLKFVSEELFKNETSVVQRGFVDKTYSEMVEIVYDELIRIDKDLEIEPTKFLHRHTSNNQKPFQFFNSVASMSVSEEENGSFYVFYEDRDKFNFVTLGKLVQKDPVEEYVYWQKNAPDPDLINNDQRPESADREIVNVEKYVVNSQINPLMNLKQGMYGSTFFHIDTIRKKTELQEFKLSEEFDSFKHVDKSKPFPEDYDLLDKTDAHIRLTLSDKDRDLQEHLTSRDEQIAQTRRYDESHLKRKSQLFQMNTLKLGVKVPGDPKITVGDMIAFNLPSNEADVYEGSPRQLDDYLQGKYLVTAVKHTIDSNKYTMTMSIMKDTLFSNIKYVDPAKKYKDIY